MSIKTIVKIKDFRAKKMKSFSLLCCKLEGKSVGQRPLKILAISVSGFSRPPAVSIWEEMWLAAGFHTCASPATTAALMRSAGLPESAQDRVLVLALDSSTCAPLHYIHWVYS